MNDAQAFPWDSCKTVGEMFRQPTLVVASMLFVSSAWGQEPLVDRVKYEPGPLPEYTLVAPAPTLQSRYAAFLGRWEGQWDGYGQPYILVISAVQEGLPGPVTADALYALTDFVDRDGKTIKAGYRKLRGWFKEEGEEPTLVLRYSLPKGDRVFQITFTRRDAESLNGRWQKTDGQSYDTSIARMAQGK